MAAVSRITACRWMLALSICCCAVMTVVFQRSATDNRRRIESLRRELELAGSSREMLLERAVRAEARATDLDKAMPGLSAGEAAAFRKRGLSDPERDIIKDLGSREELMPFEGVFGARPDFYPEVRMYLLNRKWAFASFDDGSKLGYTLLEYRVSGQGAIDWKTIDTVIFGRRSDVPAL